mmetsp:Transcript_32581/g.71501  ORF Transcript_32581/g.71501 Transcript_32581/m.71501 type:complete len:210 (-) Transcript_32581:94-723(-)
MGAREERAVQAHHVGAREQLVQRNVLDAHVLSGLVLIRVIGDDFASHANQNGHEALTNLARADDANSLAMHVEANEAREVVVALADTDAGLVDLAVEAHHQCQRMFCHSVRRVGRNTANRNAVLGGRRKINTIETSASHCNELHSVGCESIDDFRRQVVINKGAYGGASLCKLSCHWRERCINKLDFWEGLLPDFNLCVHVRLNGEDSE